MSGRENPWTSCEVQRWAFWRLPQWEQNALLSIPEAWEAIDNRRRDCAALRDEVLRWMDESTRLALYNTMHDYLQRKCNFSIEQWKDSETYAVSQLMEYLIYFFRMIKKLGELK